MAQADQTNQWAVAQSGSTPPGFDSISGYCMSINGHLHQVELPHSAVTMLFQLGDSVSVSPAGAESDAAAVAVGLTSGPIATAMPGRIECIDVRLAPPAAFELFGGTPLSELADQALDATDLTQSGALHVLDKVRDGPS